MTVQAKVPYQSYIANGADTDFYFSFYVENIENLVVKINGEVVGHGSYIYLEEENAIQFFDAPEANQVIELFRHTALEREIDYDTYTNRLRPETLNKDLDKIWLNLQEQALKVDQYDYDYTYSVSTANQALKEVKDAQARADSAYELADITNTETRPINRGGTGATSSEDARTNLNVHSKEEVVSLIQSGGTGTVVAVSGGGTGADNIADARTNLDVYNKAEANFLALPLGTPIWHNGTRLTIDDGYASYDGQLLNRADFPSLWDKVQSKFVVISDAEWLANPTKRAAYSSGDGVTTFRMPDLNGFLADSIKGLFLRGDGNGTIAGEVVSQSTILTDAIRNIKGNIGTIAIDGIIDGVFSNTGAGGRVSNDAGAARDYQADFDASRVVPTAGENRPVSAIGIWICRVSAGTAEQVLPNTAPSLSGGNTWAGSQNVQGNLAISGKLEANIKPLLNATGAAPISACRAWICFDSTTAGVVIKASNNIQSIVRTSLGRFVITFIDEMPHSDYIVLTGTRADSSTSNSTLNLVVNESYNVATQTAKTTKKLSVAYASTNGLYDGYDISLGVFC